MTVTFERPNTTEGILQAQPVDGLDLIPRSDEPDLPVKTCHRGFEWDSLGESLPRENPTGNE